MSVPGKGVAKLAAAERRNDVKGCYDRAAARFGHLIAAFEVERAA